MAGHLDDEQVRAYTSGTLPPDARRTAEAHVAACAVCTQRVTGLGETAPLFAGPAPAAVGRAADPWQPGHAVGRYVIRGRLGQGGMGAVFRAEDTELGRPVALKRLHASADDETRARLVREARAAAQLAHPNVVTVYEVGDADGTPFIAMELVDGVTLTAWLAEARRPWRAVAAMLAQAGRGLVAAHARGLVHRDFKPDNVLVDRAGRARVADFGLARAGDDDPAAPDAAPAPRDQLLGRLTATGALAGTPAYMAPEIVAGGPPDARSDQYAFAVAAFEALHGAHPFAGTTAPMLWAAMAAGEVRPRAALPRAIPAWLDRHVRRGLAVEPAARWPALAQLVAAIDPPAPRRTGLVLGGGGALALASAAAIALALRGRAPDRCAQAGASVAKIWPGQRAQVAAAVGEASPAVGGLDAYASGWLGAAGEACRADDPGELRELRAVCLDYARHRLGAVVEDLAAGGSAAAAGAPAAVDELPDLGPCADLGRLSQDTWLPATRAQQDAYDAADRDLARAAVLRDRGELAGAAALVLGARARATQLEAWTLVTRAALAAYELDRDRGDSAAAVTDAEAAKDTATHVVPAELFARASLTYLAALATTKPASFVTPIDVGSDHEPGTEAELAQILGTAQEAAGHYPDAVATFRRAQALRAPRLPADHIERLIGELDLAGALVMQHKSAEALPMLERVRDAMDRRVAPLRREVIDTLHVLAMAHEQLGHVDAAIAADREVLARRTRLFGAHAPLAAIARADLAAALSTGGYHAEAVPLYQTAIADEQTAANGKSFNAVQASVNLANDLIALDRPDDAIAVLAVARPSLVKVRGEAHVQVAIADVALAHAEIRRAALAHSTAGLADAAALLDRAGPIFAASFGAHSQPMAVILERRGNLEAARGRWDAADQAFAASLVELGPDATPADRADLELERAEPLAHLGRAADAQASAAAAARDYAAAGPGFADRVAAARAAR